MKKTEAYFLQHCENEDCDLGSFQYTCPHCNGVSDDYEVWWQEDEIYAGAAHIFKCENCETMLMVEWDKLEYGYYVTLGQNKIN